VFHAFGGHTLCFFEIFECVAVAILWLKKYREILQMFTPVKGPLLSAELAGELN